MFERIPSNPLEAIRDAAYSRIGGVTLGAISAAAIFAPGAGAKTKTFDSLKAFPTPSAHIATFETPDLANAAVAQALDPSLTSPASVSLPGDGTADVKINCNPANPAGLAEWKLGSDSTFTAQTCDSNLTNEPYPPGGAARALAAAKKALGNNNPAQSALTYEGNGSAATVTYSSQNLNAPGAVWNQAKATVVPGGQENFTFYPWPKPPTPNAPGISVPKYAIPGHILKYSFTQRGPANQSTFDLSGLPKNVALQRHGTTPWSRSSSGKPEWHIGNLGKTQTGKIIVNEAVPKKDKGLICVNVKETVTNVNRGYNRTDNSLGRFCTKLVSKLPKVTKPKQPSHSAYFNKCAKNALNPVQISIITDNYGGPNGKELFLQVGDESINNPNQPLDVCKGGLRIQLWQRESTGKGKTKPNSAAWTAFSRQLTLNDPAISYAQQKLNTFDKAKTWDIAERSTYTLNGQSESSSYSFNNNLEAWVPIK